MSGEAAAPSLDTFPLVLAALRDALRQPREHRWLAHAAQEKGAEIRQMIG